MKTPCILLVPFLSLAANPFERSPLENSAVVLHEKAVGTKSIIAAEDLAREISSRSGLDSLVVLKENSEGITLVLGAAFDSSLQAPGFFNGCDTTLTIACAEDEITGCLSGPFGISAFSQKVRLPGGAAIEIHSTSSEGEKLRILAYGRTRQD